MNIIIFLSKPFYALFLVIKQQGYKNGFYFTYVRNYGLNYSCCSAIIFGLTSSKIDDMVYNEFLLLLHLSFIIIIFINFLIWSFEPDRSHGA